MAIDPIQFQTSQVAGADFTPLANLGKAWQQQQTLDDLARVYGASYAPTSAPTAAAPGSVAPAPSGSSAYSRAISNIESGGRYDLMGPATGSGDRAYGKYQVMGANIPGWTKEALGQPMTAAQFLASPQAQEAVFNTKFGQYVDKYGPRDAAKAWFAGEGGMKNPNASDLYGTTVQGYADKFVRNLGQ